MSSTLTSSAPISPESGPEDTYAAMRTRVEGTNINPDTLLATDYLNHFNEVIMILEMVGDMPEMLEDVKAWQPKSYAEHFRDSGLSVGELAIEAYACSPPRHREAFERTIDQIHHVLAKGIDNIEQAIAGGHPELIRLAAQAVSRALQLLNDTASAIIHGGENTMDQAHIDELLGHPQPSGGSDAGATAEAASDGLDQSAIDSLFD